MGRTSLAPRGVSVAVDRKGERPVSHLSGYKGWVDADGFAGFNGLIGVDRADEMACMMHVWRKYLDVLRRKVRPVLRRQSSASPSFMPSRKTLVVKLRRNSLVCARRRLNLSSMIWKHGCILSFQIYSASLHWPKPFAMPSTEYQKLCPI